MKDWQKAKTELEAYKTQLEADVARAEQLRRIMKNHDGKILNIKVYRNIEAISSNELSAYKADDRVTFHTQHPWREIFRPKYDNITTNRRFDFEKFNKELAKIIQWHRRDIANTESDLLIGQEVFAEIEQTKAYLDQLENKLSSHTRYEYLH